MCQVIFLPFSIAGNNKKACRGSKTGRLNSFQKKNTIFIYIFIYLFMFVRIQAAVGLKTFLDRKQLEMDFCLLR